MRGAHLIKDVPEERKHARPRKANCLSRKSIRPSKCEEETQCSQNSSLLFLVNSSGALLALRKTRVVEEKWLKGGREDYS